MYKKSFTALAITLVVLVVVTAPSIEAATYAITVQTDASSYSGAQTLLASGAVSPPPGPGTAVALKILNPSGTLAAIGSAPVNGSTGSYQHSFVLGGSTNWVAGTYTVNATWGNSATGPAISKTTTFAYSPSVSTTTSSTTTSSTLTAPSTSSSSTSSTQTTTSSSTQSGGGGIPEFPFQILTVTFFTFVLVASYLLARRYAMPGGRLRRP
ncbi:MAG: hypothetical protein LYZ69_05925 [Nitrososphaerales archaeon]|nr:hypothetical protein [Nitrososphaerales archaeon]